MLALPDNHDVVAVAHQRRDGAMRDVHQRTGRFDDRQSERACTGQGPLGCAMGRHHHGGGGDVGEVLRHGDAPGLESAQDGGIVNEVAQDGQGAGVGMLERERDGIANAEAHAEVGRSEDTHTLQCKVYPAARHVKSGS